MNQEKYFNLGTLKRDGSYVDTPVWFVQEQEGNGYLIIANVNSGKVKRIRNFSTARIAISDYRGRLKGEWQEAEVELVPGPEPLMNLFRIKYGVSFKIYEFFSWLFGKSKQHQMIRIVLLDQRNLR